MQYLELLKAYVKLRLHYLRQSLTNEAAEIKQQYNFKQSSKIYGYKVRYYRPRYALGNVLFDRRILKRPVCFVLVRNEPVIMIDVDHAPITATTLTMHVEHCIREICDFQSDAMQIGDGFVIRDGDTHEIPTKGRYEFIAPTLY